MGNVENNRIGFYFMNVQNENSNNKKGINNYCYYKKNYDPAIPIKEIVNEEEKKMKNLKMLKIQNS